MSSLLEADTAMATLDALDNGVLLLRRNGATARAPTIVYANRGAERILGLPRDALLQRRLRAIGPLESSRRGFIELLGCIHRGVPAAVSLELAGPASEPVSVAADGAPLPDRSEFYVLRLRALDRPDSGSGPVEVTRLARLDGGALYRLQIDPLGAFRLSWADPALAELVGIGLEPLIASGGWHDLILPGDRAAFQRRNQRLIAGDQVEARYRLRLPTGAILRVVDRAVAEAPTPDGVVRAITGVIRPLVASQEIAETASLAAELLRDGLICVIGDDLRIVRVEGGQDDPLGVRLRAALGAPLAAALDQEAAEDWADWIDQSRLAGARVSGRFMIDGETRDASFLARGEGDALVVLQAKGAPETVSGWDGLDVPILLLDRQRAVRSANRAAGQKLGLASAVLAGRRFDELVGPGLAEEAPPGWGLVPIADDSFLAMPADALAASEDFRRRGLLDHVVDGIVELDPGLRVAWVNRATARMFGRTAAALVGVPLTELVGPVAQGEGELERLLQAAGPEAVSFGEWQARRGDGVPILVEVLGGRLEQAGETRIVLTLRDVTLRRETEETIRNLAYNDPLTGLPNRLLFHDRLSQAIERARRNRQMLAVMLVDLDRFKLINDSLGLDKGDHLLRQVAKRLVGALRKSDTVGRFSGDEFMVLAPGTESVEAAAKVAQKLLDALKEPFDIDGRDITIAASVGIALYPLDGEAPEPLLKNADTALGRAKEQGRNSYQFYKTEMNARALQRLMLESGLRRALEHGELLLHYQPQVSLETGRIVGVEALLRWQHPELGMVPPSEFVPIAEETGLIVPIGEWVLRTAARTMLEWDRGGLPAIRLAVNLSARQFNDPELVPRIAAILGETGFPAERLELELTESMIMHDAPETVSRLGEIAALGIRLTIDDFGSGYSSLSYLRRFPITALKIDQSFIRDVTRDPNDAAIAQAIVALAGSLRLKVVAEGVETQEQLAFLKSCGCDEVQGYLFSRPLPDEAARRLISSRTVFSL
jgi:diguanylate cyclase (GGDEF)-like protein/PAS domain S-box-containing protein